MGVPEGEALHLCEDVNLTVSEAIPCHLRRSTLGCSLLQWPFGARFWGRSLRAGLLIEMKLIQPDRSMKSIDSHLMDIVSTTGQRLVDCAQ